MSISVTTVRNEEGLDLLFEIRRQVFVEEQNVPEEDERDCYEEESVHFLATYKGTVCGTARRRVTPLGVKLERFAVLEEFRGKGVGSALVKAVIDDCVNDSTTKGLLLYLHAQTQVVPLYEKYGFVCIGDEFDECGIMHFKMILKIN